MYALATPRHVTPMLATGNQSLKDKSVIAEVYL